MAVRISSTSVVAVAVVGVSSAVGVVVFSASAIIARPANGVATVTAGLRCGRRHLIRCTDHDSYHDDDGDDADDDPGN